MTQDLRLNSLWSIKEGSYWRHSSVVEGPPSMYGVWFPQAEKQKRKDGREVGRRQKGRKGMNAYMTNPSHLHRTDHFHNRSFHFSSSLLNQIFFLSEPKYRDRLTHVWAGGILQIYTTSNISKRSTACLRSCCEYEGRGMECSIRWRLKYSFLLVVKAVLQK